MECHLDSANSIACAACNLKRFLAATGSNSLPLVFKNLRILRLQLSAISEIGTSTLPEVQNGRKALLQTAASMDLLTRYLQTKAAAI
jgi:hypothetical protein